jgi:hypothetical protein
MPPSISLGSTLLTASAAVGLAMAAMGDVRARTAPDHPAGATIELTPVADTWYEVEVGTGAPVNPTPQGGSDRLNAGWSDIGIDEHALLLFDLPTGMTASQLQRAELALQVMEADILTFGLPTPDSGTIRLALERATSPWSEATLSSLAPPQVAATGVRVDWPWRPCSPGNCGTARMDVTALVSAWLRGSMANYGLGVHAGGFLGDEPVMGTVFVAGSRESDRPPVLRIKQFGPDDPTSTPEDATATLPATGQPSPSSTAIAPSPSSTAVVPSPAATSAPASATPGALAALWLPLALRDPPPARTPTPRAAPTETPTLAPTPGQGPYLLVERWANQERGPACMPMYIDFPTYRFDPSTGTLHLWPRYGQNPALEPMDVGYFGTGGTVSGRGGGESSRLRRMERLPFETEDTRILSVDSYGVVEASDLLTGESLVLLPGEERLWQAVSSGDDLTPGCVITTTERLTNYGYQDRAKIVYD